MNFSINTKYPSIEKEAILGMKFPKGEVLNTQAEIALRAHSLGEACRLGNEFKGKVRIIFVSEQGIKEVHTTIWNVGEEAVSLKGGVFIPVHAILHVEPL